MGSWRDRWPNTRTKAIWYAKSPADCRSPALGNPFPISLLEAGIKDHTRTENVKVRGGNSFVTRKRVF